MKIVILDGYAVNPGDLSWEPLAAQGELTVYDRTVPEETRAHMGDAEIVFTNKTLVTRELIEDCPSLKLLGVLATGYNSVDCTAAQEKGIPVVNIPAYSTASVAQLVIALLLEACQRVGDHSRAVHEGKWCRSKDFAYWDYPMMELDGKTMGIVGFGNIGQKVAEIARALGMEILYHARSPKPELENEKVQFASLDEIYAKSDVITLHCPLFPETTGLINQESIPKMKDGVILINTSRGPIIDEQAVADALRTGKIAYAGVDVLSFEPMKEDNPLLGAPNCFITPHIGWAPIEARRRLMDMAGENLRAFLDGKPIHVVNGVS